MSKDNQVTVEQVNTGKSRIYELFKPFAEYTEHDFKILIAEQEMIPVKAIRFQNLEKHQEDEVMIQNLYPENKVYYRALFIEEALPDNVTNISANCIDKDARKRAEKIYPFSVFATDAMVGMLLETNRINEVDENIYDINRGLLFEGSKEEDVPYKQKASFLNIQDICIRPMTQNQCDNWRGKSEFTFVCHHADKSVSQKVVSISRTIMIGELKALLLTKLDQGPFYFKFNLYNWEKMQKLFDMEQEWNKEFDKPANEGPNLINVYLDVQNYDMWLDSEDGVISKRQLITGVNDSTPMIDLYKKFEEAYEKQSGGPVASDLCFHLEDEIGIMKSDSSLNCKKFSDFGINRFSKIKFNMHQKCDLANADDFKAGFQVEIKYQEYMSQLKFNVKNADAQSVNGKNQLYQNKEMVRQFPSDQQKVKISELLKSIFGIMKNADDGSLGRLTHKNLRLYSMLGQELDSDKTLDDYASVNNDKNKSFRFVIDFRNILIVRLMGGSKFVLIPKTNEIKTVQDVMDQIDEETLKYTEKSRDYHNIDKDALLQLLYNHLFLQTDIQLKKLIKAGPSSGMQFNLILSRMTNKKKEYVINLDYKWMQLDLMSRVYSTLPMLEECEIDFEEVSVVSEIKNKPEKKKGMFARIKELNPFKKAHKQETKKKEETKADDRCTLMLNELKKVCNDTEQFKGDTKIIYDAQKKGMDSEEMFKALVKIYSGESLHQPFGRKLVAGKYNLIHNYLTAYVDCLNKHSLKFAYTSFTLPLYRAIDPQEKFDINQYKLNSINQWPLFQRTTKNQSRALTDSYELQTSGEKSFTDSICMFKIFLRDKNKPSHHIELSGDEFTWFKVENEILLSPFFTFQVVEVNKEKEQRHTEIETSIYDVNEKETKIKKTIWYQLTVITLVEVAYQDNLRTKQVLPHTVIMFDKSVNDAEITNRRHSSQNQDDENDLDEEVQQTGQQLHEYVKSTAVPFIEKNFTKSHFQFVDQKQEALECIGASLRATLIVSGQDGYDFIHQMYEHKLAPNTNIVNVIIYCPQKEMQKLKSDFESKEYPVPIEYVLQDKLDELKKAIDDFTQDALNGKFVEAFEEKAYYADQKHEEQKN